MTITGIILVICGFILFICFLCINDIPDILGGIIYALSYLLIFIGIYLLAITKKPTENDVLEGRATYQETIRIIDNDTVKTYKIIWRDAYERE